MELDETLFESPKDVFSHVYESCASTAELGGILDGRDGVSEHQLESRLRR